jgi:hypothetical protein
MTEVGLPELFLDLLELLNHACHGLPAGNS